MCIHGFVGACAECDGAGQQPEVIVEERSVRCSCGARVELDGGDTECSRCGQPFNAFGQRLRRYDAHDPDCAGCHECC